MKNGKRCSMRQAGVLMNTCRTSGTYKLKKKRNQKGFCDIIIFGATTFLHLHNLLNQFRSCGVVFTGVCGVGLGIAAYITEDAIRGC